MDKPDITSASRWLIAAVLAVGGISIFDSLVLRPDAACKRRLAYSRRARQAEATLLRALDHMQRQMASAGRAAAAQLDPSKPAPENLPARVAPAAGAEAAWLRDPNGAVRGLWTGPGWAPSPQALAACALPAEAGSTSGAGTTPGGIARLDGAVCVVAAVALPAANGQGEPGRLYLARRVDGRFLAAVDPEPSTHFGFLARDGLPPAGRLAALSRYRLWPAGPGRVQVAWEAEDPTGLPVGFWTCGMPVPDAVARAEGLRRATLAGLWGVVLVVALAVLAARFFARTPIRRLVRRLQEVETGERAIDELTEGLRGEPLALAERFRSTLGSMNALSLTDELTGLANRRQLDTALEKEFDQARRYHRPLSVMVMDIDMFKAINDTKGHQAGDWVIKIIAEIIRRCCRKSDIPVRLGGDEFAVLLPETQAPSAAVVAERIRRSVVEEPIIVDGTELNVTVSIGVADMTCGKVNKPEDLLALGDEALYEAKQLGRNRFVLASEIETDDWSEAAGESDRVEMLRGKLAGLDTQFKSLFVRALQEIVRAMERRDPHMADHARKVQHYSSLMGKQLGLSEDLIRQIEMASLLHDIGMLALPDEILLCPGRLTDEQLASMRRHPVIGARILEGTEFLEQVIPVVRFHHERFDGKGYPDGLSGLGIPPICRIVAIADSFDAMTSRRSFRDAMDFRVAFDEIRRGAGSQFDPDMVDAFLAAAKAHGEKFFLGGRARPTSHTSPQPTEPPTPSDAPGAAEADPAAALSAMEPPAS